MKPETDFFHVQRKYCLLQKVMKWKSTRLIKNERKKIGLKIEHFFAVVFVTFSHSPVGLYISNRFRFNRNKKEHSFGDKEQHKKMVEIHVNAKRLLQKQNRSNANRNEKKEKLKHIQRMHFTILRECICVLYKNIEHKFFPFFIGYV